MPNIFISYRRQDSAGHAGRLFDRLKTRFGANQVFMDVVGIEAGTDFVETIEQAVGSCDVLLAVIGREWLTSQRSNGTRRLDDPNDFVRLEIAAALKRNVRVIPLLVEGAEMPSAEELPEEIRLLHRRNAFELRDNRWQADIEDFADNLAKFVGGASKKPKQPNLRVLAVWLAVLLAVVGTIGAGYYFWKNPPRLVAQSSPSKNIKAPIYLQYMKGDNEDLVKKIMASLNQQGWKVDGPEPIANQTTQGEVRYLGDLKQQAEQLAKDVQNTLAATGYAGTITVNQLDPEKFKGKPQLEIWLPKLQSQ